MNARTRLVLVVVTVAALTAALWFFLSCPAKNPTTVSSIDTAPIVRGSTTAAEVAPPPMVRPSVARADAAARVAARWGGGTGELGRSRPPEGNPEGPMSFVRDGDELLVLDQVNRRVVRYDAVGGVGASFEVSNTTQDIAVAKDGTVALLDRLVDKTVRLTDAKGHVIATLPLSSDRVPESGLVTGMFVDGKDIYVEKEHGVLVRVGSTDGRVGAPAELNGRPSKDGALLLMAALTAAEARVTLNAFDRKLGTLRFARTIAFARPALEVVLVDTDRRGTIYVGVSGGQPPSLHVACLDPGDGHVLGRVTLASSLAPEEAFREVTIADDGTIVSAYRTDEGVEYRTSRCPGM